jgi:hypothetical protein
MSSEVVPCHNVSHPHLTSRLRRQSPFELRQLRKFWAVWPLYIMQLDAANRHAPSVVHSRSRGFNCAYSAMTRDSGTFFKLKTDQ